MLGKTERADAAGPWTRLGNDVTVRSHYLILPCSVLPFAPWLAMDTPTAKRSGLTARALASKAASSSRENLVGKTVLVRGIDGCVLSLPAFANKEQGANRYRIPANFPISSALAAKDWLRVPAYDTLKEESHWERAHFTPKAFLWPGHSTRAPEDAKIGEHEGVDVTAIANVPQPIFEDVDCANLDGVATPRTPSPSPE